MSEVVPDLAWMKRVATGTRAATPSAREHRAVVEAIRLGDAAAARERAKRHRMAARDQILPLLGQLGMRHL